MKISKKSWHFFLYKLIILEHRKLSEDTSFFISYEQYTRTTYLDYVNSVSIISEPEEHTKRFLEMPRKKQLTILGYFSTFFVTLPIIIFFHLFYNLLFMLLLITMFYVTFITNSFLYVLVAATILLAIFLNSAILLILLILFQNIPNAYYYISSKFKVNKNPYNSKNNKPPSRFRIEVE